MKTTNDQRPKGRLVPDNTNDKSKGKKNESGSKRYRNLEVAGWTLDTRTVRWKNHSSGPSLLTFQ